VHYRYLCNGAKNKQLLCRIGLLLQRFSTFLAPSPGCRHILWDAFKKFGRKMLMKSTPGNRHLLNTLACKKLLPKILTKVFLPSKKAQNQSSPHNQKVKAAKNDLKNKHYSTLYLFNTSRWKKPWNFFPSLSLFAFEWIRFLYYWYSDHIFRLTNSKKNESWFHFDAKKFPPFFFDKRLSWEANFFSNEQNQV